MSEDLFGRYAFYILTAYGATAATFAVLVVHAWRRLRYWARRARESEKRRGAP
ncbi:MAG: heme exporter protein CcmD [Hyphomonadaceae bacterium]